MRVLQIMECTIGGTRRHLGDLAQGLARMGIDVHVVAAVVRQPDFAEDLARLVRAGVRVTRLDMRRELAPAVDARHLTALARLLERERPSIVHTHSSKAGSLGRLASVATGIGARVHTPHTYSFLFDAMFPAWKRSLFFEIERGLSAHTQRLIAVSASEAETIVKSGVAEKSRVRVVENGIDPEPWMEALALARGEVAPVFGSAPGPRRLLGAVVGLLNVAKGQDLALEALARPELAALDLVIVGHGALEAELRAQAHRLGLEQRVRFLGFRRDVPRILASVDFVLVPSRWEGMPYVVLEAFAAARPVVATPVDGARDIIVSGQNGFLARHSDVDAIAEALRKVCALSVLDRERLGSAGRAHVLERSSAKRMCAQVAALYQEIA